jgi:uncharacterized protein (TIGR00266 family)
MSDTLAYQRVMSQRSKNNTGKVCAVEIEIKHQPAFALAIVRLAPSEEIKVEPGAMVSFSEGITSDTEVAGGFMSGLRRVLGGESFFQNAFRAPAEGGEITLAPALMGDIAVLNVTPEQTLLLQSGAYLAAEQAVSFDTSWGGARGFFGGTGLLLLRVSGQGKLLYAGYGGLEERLLQDGQRYTIDTGHIVAMDASIDYKVRGMGRLKGTLFSGEGLVGELTGPGRVIMQSRSEADFINWLVPRLPSSNRSN